MLQRLKRPFCMADAPSVIRLHRIHAHSEFFVNPDLIEMIEACPDTTITLVNKHRYVVEETVETVIDEIVGFRARVARNAGTMSDFAAGARSLNINTTASEQAA